MSTQVPFGDPFWNELLACPTLLAALGQDAAGAADSNNPVMAHFGERMRKCLILMCTLLVDQIQFTRGSHHLLSNFSASLTPTHIPQPVMPTPHSVVQPPLGEPGAARAAHHPLPQPRPRRGHSRVRIHLLLRARRLSINITRDDDADAGFDGVGCLCLRRGIREGAAGGGRGGGRGLLHPGGHERDAAHGGLCRCGIIVRA